MAVILARYRKLIACFFFLARYRRLIACFSGPLQETIACFSGPSSLTISAKSAILELKGGSNEIFTLCMMFRGVISFIYEKILFGDRVPLTLSIAGGGAIFATLFRYCLAIFNRYTILKILA